MTFATWSQTAASNTSVGGISTDGNVTLVNQIDNMFRGMMAELAVARDDGTIINVYPRRYIDGLILSNNAGDATNDIDISAGECVTTDSPYWRMALTASITKRLDAAWAVGTGNGGLDTGAIANTTYHVWLIQRSDTLVVDALFSASATAPTMPANYDRKRYLGPVIRSAGALLNFRHFGGGATSVMKLVTPITSISGTAAYGSLLTTMGGPTGIICQPIFNAQVVTPAARNANLFVGDAAIGGINGTILQAGSAGSTETNTTSANVSGGFYSDTSCRIYTSLATTGSGAVTSFSIAIIGWVYER